MSRAVRLLATSAGLLVAMALAITALAWHRAIDPVARPDPSRIDASLVARGAALAGVGNCASCHTTATGMPYAGGVAIATPFGTIHGTNITPDEDAGIGRWSRPAFVRAMRRGISRDGHLLYPAFPYTHFTHASDGDLDALYAYLMTRDAADARTPPNRLAFPFGLRPLLAGWNLLFFSDPGDHDPVRDAAERDRGAYLVESLGHCGACHTPRNALGAEKNRDRFGGGVVDGWYAPPLDAASPSPVPWTVDAMTAYLKRGLVADHAIAGGPMQRAVAGLARASDADVAAIARTIVADMGPVDGTRQGRADAARARAATPLADASATESGALVYATACASCHDGGRDASSANAMPLSLAVALYDDEPHSFVRIVRDGIDAPPGEPGRVMPAFGESLTDVQLAALAAWLRRAAAGAPPWNRLDDVVRERRR